MDKAREGGFGLWVDGWVRRAGEGGGGRGSESAGKVNGVTRF